MKEMLGLQPDEYTGVEIALKDATQANAVRSALKTLFGDSYLVQTRYEQNQNLYSVMRVEKWVMNGRVAYNVIGIIWGGSKPTNALSIRFKSGAPWTRVDDCPLPASTLTWSLWSHTWRPAEPGRYQIVLRVDDPSIRTRRLDIFFYVREIQIDEA